ncbi:hypothetical protein HO133_006657 [Letharia lupina]|uniref:Uncharacterized protein n=1 Tax=Letharia lupina TaxID=560253 RepID=A0A8H6C5P3_9LECA|nr:uncharacterized protein HO133_006657 [Letharia lupina]KAF6217555.1 hypothetical protein HO133_006657 [Letharia lupina]
MSTTKCSFKRPFQPSISSYFGHPTRDSAQTPGTQVHTPSFALPNTIQSSLLNVGMRVRKSVPEGYQTQRKLSCGVPSAYNNLTPERNSVTPSRGFTGLVPYCGILKIGGHNTQPAPSEEDLPPLQFDSDDWGFLSSQESKASSDSLRPIVTVPVVSNHKRRREDEDDELDVESQPVSPLPKTRKKPVLESFELKESEMIDVGGFGEAEFFRPDEWENDWGHAKET